MLRTCSSKDNWENVTPRSIAETTRSMPTNGHESAGRAEGL